MNEEKIYNPSEQIIKNSNISESEFEELYKDSLSNPDEFWGAQAETYLDQI